MNAIELSLYLVGGALLVIGTFMLLTDPEIAEVVPTSAAVAGVILLVGLVVMGLASRFRKEPEDRGVKEVEYRY